MIPKNKDDLTKRRKMGWKTQLLSIKKMVFGPSHSRNGRAKRIFSDRSSFLGKGYKRQAQGETVLGGAICELWGWCSVQKVCPTLLHFRDLFHGWRTATLQETLKFLGEFLVGYSWAIKHESGKMILSQQQKKPSIFSRSHPDQNTRDVF